MKFIVEIDLGNDSMQSYGDVRDTLQRLVTALRHLEDYSPITRDGGGSIADANGNTVGSWRLAETASTLDSMVPKSPFENDSCCAGDTFHRSNCYKARPDYQPEVNVCIVGNPARDGVCGEPDCLCGPALVEEPVCVGCGAALIGSEKRGPRCNRCLAGVSHVV